MQNKRINLPQIPERFSDKAHKIYLMLNSDRLMLFEKLETVYRFIDELNSDYVSQYVTCQRGCKNCCYMDVRITTLEAENIYLETAIRLKPGDNVTTNHRSPCVFLNNGGDCGICQHRPLVCRMFHAQGDPENCKPGRMQLEYNVNSNEIYPKLIAWSHHVTLTGGGCIRDIRDFFG